MNNLVRGLNVQLSITNDERAARRNEKPRPLEAVAKSNFVKLAVNYAAHGVITKFGLPVSSRTFFLSPFGVRADRVPN